MKIRRHRGDTMTTKLRDLALRELDLSKVRLSSGHGPDPGDGVPTQACVMDLVAWRAGEAWSDSPSCASPVLTKFCVSWNDGMNDTDRQMLVPYIDRLIGTRSNAKVEKQREYMILDWFVRVSAPTWLRAANLDAEAQAVEATPPITGKASAKTAIEALAAAGDAARDAAGDAASALRLLDALIEVRG